MSPTPDRIKTKIQTWFRERANEILSDRVILYAEMMHLSYERITIKKLKSRWGSCSSKGNLNFNLSLIMAPIEVLDYVVVHELAHLVHMNHSSEFWGLVETYCPGYKVHRKWLREHGAFLRII